MRVPAGTRHRWVAVVVTGVLVTTAACTGGPKASPRSPPKPAGGTAMASADAGLVPGKEWKARQEDYLRWVRTSSFNPSDPLTILAFGPRADLSSVTTTTLQPVLQKVGSFADTSDFDVNNLLNLFLRLGSRLNPQLRQTLKDELVGFKYWWTEPTPPGVIDSQYYWTENHQIIFLADEYVAGQTFPHDRFTNSGMTGRQHLEHAKTRIDKWIDLRARFGFSEWLSNVYWMEDFKGLLLLAELAEDPVVARKASMVLDMMFTELASHLQNGSFGVTHGRSYMKDKLTALDENTFSLAKLVFDDTDRQYPAVDNAVLLATATRYRPPEVTRRIAKTAAVGEVRQHQSLPVPDLSKVEPTLKPPYGLTYEGEDGLMVWWGVGAQFTWPVVALSARTVEGLNLWHATNFEQAAEFQPVVEGSTPDQLRTLAATLAVPVNAGLLSAADTETWRSPDVMLSTVQDWRPGQRSEQVHTSQATLDADAEVFVNHPTDSVPARSDPNAHEGYWTGEGATPRAAQHGTATIEIYAPQYDSGVIGLKYQPFTHAFFPTEKFDQVVERNGWVIGRKGDGYVAVWSWRPAHWRPYDPATEYSHGLTRPFDWVADGGPDNVWITQVGRAADHRSQPDPFAAFVDAVTATAPQVTPGSTGVACPSAPACPHAPNASNEGFDVAYQSPVEGPMTFGFTPHSAVKTAPLVVRGALVDLHPPGLRWSSPWAQAAWASRRYHASVDGWSLDLDFTTGARRTAGPCGPNGCGS